MVLGSPVSVPNIGSSPTVLNPMICTSDGTLVTGQLIAPDFRYVEIDSIAPDKLTNSFPIRSDRVPGFTHVQFFTYYANLSEIAVLGAGTPPSEMASIASAKNYIFLFDRKGAFKSAVLLDLPVEVGRMAILESGKFVVSGINRASAHPALAIVNEDGSLARYLDLPLDSADDVRKAYPGELGNGADELMGDRVNDLLIFRQFITFRGHLLLVSGKSTLPIFEISDSGVVGSLEIHLPKGMRLQSFVQSDRNWLTVLESSNGDGSHGEYYLYEFNPTTGDPIRRLDTSISPSAIICAAGNILTGFSVDFEDKNDPHLRLLTGAY